MRNIVLPALLGPHSKIWRGFVAVVIVHPKLSRDVRSSRAARNLAARSLCLRGPSTPQVPRPPPLIVGGHATFGATSLRSRRALRWRDGGRAPPCTRSGA